MKNKDVRWKQRFDNYQKALKLLEEGVTLKKRNKIQKAGVVQFFEMTFELAWKMLKDFLEEEGYKEIKAPRPIIKKAFEIGLIEKGHDWLQLLYDRNLTAHTYDEETAEKLDILIEHKYYPLFKQLLKTFLKLEQENE